MTRRISQINDSLDVLLDTITNTFGGILFLALLVAILVQFSGSEIREQQADNASDEDLLALREEVEVKTAELQSLIRSLETLQETLAGFKPEESEPIIDEILELRRRKRALQQRHLELVTVVSQRGSQNIELDAELQELGSKLNNSQNEAERLQQELEAEVRKRTRMARLPALRSTTKREFAVVLRYGRLYFLHASEFDKFQRVLNYEDFVVLAEEESTIRITPKPYSGIVIDVSLNIDEVLKQRLSPLDSSEMYLAIAVWEDSFGNFGHLRNALVALGWEYRLIPLDQFGIVSETHVEDPLVQ